ncbi:phage tail assembly protein [Pseudomonadota bacterium]|nr:phage tail assembly protein [Pseudomonadota bacterium]
MEQLTLRKPITAHGEELHVLEFADPTSRDLQNHGQPVKFDADENFQFNMKSVAGYVSACCKIPPSSVDQMDARDLNDAAPMVAGFFGEGE